MLRCIRCGNPIRGTAQFCEVCQQQVNEERQFQTPQPAATPGGPMTAAAPSTSCPACGTPLPVGAQFCQNCGARTPNILLVANYNVVGLRLVAGLIDLILLGVVFLVMAATIGTFGSTGSRGFEIRLENGQFLLYIAIVYGYYIVSEALAGVTIGKLLMGLQVVKMNGQPYDLGAVPLRNVLRIVDGLPVFYIVGILCIAVNEKKQRIGDLAAGTLVVRVGS